jgi:hypothetical protein
MSRVMTMDYLLQPKGSRKTLKDLEWRTEVIRLVFFCFGGIEV